MLRAIVVVLCLAAADAGLRIGKPSGAGALKMATREEEKKAKEERRAKRKAAMSKDPEQARKELKERLAGYGTGEARARKYMQIARTKKFGMSDEEFAKQQQTYGRVAMDEAQMEMRRRAEKARDAVETQRIKENRSRVFRRVTGRAAKATDPVDADPTLAPVAVAVLVAVRVVPVSVRPAARAVAVATAKNSSRWMCRATRRWMHRSPRARLSSSGPRLRSISARSSTVRRPTSSGSSCRPARWSPPPSR